MDIPDEILTLFKALVDANRLKILGLLAQKEATTVQLAEGLGTRPAALLRHLDYLEQTGLVSVTETTAGEVYRLNARHLERMARQVLAGSRPAIEVPQGSLEDEERKIVRNYTRPDGSLKLIPLQAKKLLAILHHLAPVFERGRQYSEKQVNEILAGYHKDTAALRRALVDHGLLARERNGAFYWRV
jgi:DNA-binding transcriptional ArsR family regulator